MVEINSHASGEVPALLVVRLPKTDYVLACEMQGAIVNRKTRGPFDDVMFHVEHPWTITLGTRGDQSDLRVSSQVLAENGIALCHTDRGGRATFHGPGQAVCYPIVDLRRMGMSARDYVWNLEEIVIRTLADFGVNGYRQSGKVGVWVGPTDKIASVGVRIQRRITSHGFSLNVDMGQDPSRFMVSCGMSDARQANLADLTSRKVCVEEVQNVITRSFTEVFQPAYVKEVAPRDLEMLAPLCSSHGPNMRLPGS